MPRAPTDAEGPPDPDLVQLVRNLAVAHAREDYRRATGQLGEGDVGSGKPAGEKRIAKRRVRS